MLPTGGYFPATMYTTVVNPAIGSMDNGTGTEFKDIKAVGDKPKPTKPGPTYDTVTLGIMSAKMLEMVIFQILPIYNGEESSFITPGVASFDEKTDDKMFLGIGPIGSFKGGTRINILTGEKGE